MRLRIPKAFRALSDTKARYYGFYGGRGSAKSYSIANHLVLAAAQRPIRVLCCREIQRSIRESVKATLDTVITRNGLQRAFVSTAAQLGSRAGAQFLFEGLRSNIMKIQSLADIDVVWVEEAQSVSQASLDILIPTIRNAGSKLIFTWNPRSARDPVDKMFRGEGAGDMEGVALPAEYGAWMVSRQVNHDDNPFFPDVLRAEMERDKRRDREKYLHIWEGQYARLSSAAVFKNWRIGEVDVPARARPYYGADWGFSVDPTVLVRVFLLPLIRVIYIDAEVSGVGVPIDKTPKLFDSICESLDDPYHPRKWSIRADSSRPETIDYMARHGYPKIERARKGPGSIEEGVEFLQSWDIVVHPNCKRVIDEMTTYSYETDPLTNDVLPRLADEDNHTIDAIRYAVEDERRGVTLNAYPEVVRQGYVPFGTADNQATDPTKPRVRGATPPSRGLLW